MLLNEYAIKWWFAYPPHLTTVSALPGETGTRKSRLSNAMLIVCQSLATLAADDARLVCCVTARSAGNDVITISSSDEADELAAAAGEEDVICCVCNILRDEGKMIQCERCHVCTVVITIDSLEKLRNLIAARVNSWRMCLVFDVLVRSLR